jgi:hypothetical protein
MRKNEVIVESSLCLLLEVVQNFKSFGVHNNMNTESAIEKLQQIEREK